MAEENNSKFDLQTVHDNFMSALHDEDDIKLKLYLDSYDELNKFFLLLGTLFGFVSKDLKQKMEILFEFVEDEAKAEYFETVKKMIAYEKENQLLNKKGYTSGSRTLLRLHRGLDFIREFLKKLSEIRDEDHTSHVCRQAYDQTLAKHHPFMVKNAAKIAMYALPTREQLLKKVCGQQEEIERALQLLPSTLEATAIVYERIETLYTVHDLHSLP